jgi:hypothetical protein
VLCKKTLYHQDSHQLLPELLGCLCSTNSCVVHHLAVATPTPIATVISKRLAARRKRTTLAVAAMLGAESTCGGPSPSAPESPPRDDGDSTTIVGIVGSVRAIAESSSKLKWGTIA